MSGTRHRLLVSSQPELDQHDTGPGHPERAERVLAATRGLTELRLADGGVAEGGVADHIQWLPPVPATRTELLRVHDAGYLDFLIDLAAAGGGQLDPDTQVSPGSWHTALIAAGAGLAAVAAIDAGDANRGFLLTRPPGHHAGRYSGSGFCLLNNIAVTAASLIARGERVAIIDWDVHHGNGTQDIFYDSPDVLYLSVHQWPMYPGTGGPDERGAGLGRGATLNAPLPPHSGGDAYRAVFDERLLPLLRDFDPTWVLVSAGFDAHRDDPLADMDLTSADYADLTDRILRAAGELPVLLFLEGGYDLAALSASVAACGAVLIGGPS